MHFEKSSVVYLPESKKVDIVPAGQVTSFAVDKACIATGTYQKWQEECDIKADQ